MAYPIALGRDLQDWLEAAGIIPKDAPVRRVVIDAAANEPIKVYVELYGSKKMLNVTCPESLSGAKVQILDAVGTPSYG